MSTSVFLLGTSKAHAREVDALLDGSSKRFLTLAQRIVWGLGQSDLVRVDVPAELRALSRAYPEHPMTALLTAYALRQSAPEQAQAALDAARARMGSDHPWRFMLPSEQSVSEPKQTLHEVMRERVWRVESTFSADGSSYQVGSVGTLVRTERGELVFVNPVPLSPEVHARVVGLGAMRALTLQGRAHSRFVDVCRSQFPRARVVLTEGHRVHPTSAHLRFDALLDSSRPVLPEEFIELPVRGTDADEVVLLHAPTRLLIFQDLVANNLSSHAGRSFSGRLEYFAFGLIDRIGMLSYHPMLWRDMLALKESLVAIRRSPYEYVTGAHWPLELCEAAKSREAFNQTLDFITGMSKARHLGYLAEFFTRQPGFLRDLLRYKNRT